MSAARSGVRAHALSYTGLAVLFLFTCVHLVRDTGDRLDEMLYGGQYVGSPFDLNELNLAATALDSVASDGGLKDGDIVLAVNGRPVRGFADYNAELRRARVGDRLNLRVRSGSVEKDLSVPLRQFTYLGFKQGDAAYIPIILVRIAIPLFCVTLGFWVAGVRIHDKAAWMLLMLMLSVACLIQDSRTTLGRDDALQPFLTAFAWGFSTLSPMALAAFGIVFPERLALDRRWPWLKWVVLGPLAVRALLAALGGYFVLHDHQTALSLWPISKPLLDLGMYLGPAAIAIFFLALGYKTFTASNPDARRRLLLLCAGTVISVLPFTTLVIISITHGYHWSGWSAVIPMITLALLPLTMAYVIVVHRAMDVRVVIRQGLQYVLATGGIRVIQVAISIAIVVVAATMSAGAGVTGRVLFIALGFGLIVGIGSFALRLRRWIDRRFFREAYEADAILSDLAAQVRTIVETEPLLQTVAARIAKSLHVERIAILLNQGGAFRPAYALGYAPAASIPEDGLTVKRLRKQQHAHVEFDDDGSWVQLTDGLERESLKELKPELLLPLSLNDKLLGIVSLGPKQSEEPFSKTDIRLLDSVAAQTGLALENGRLTEAIKAEVAAREKHKRELELAHEVQERLFPQHYPPVPGLDYKGACRPALGVGGDYYDFIQLPANSLGIAIGDVSGKGIPAALLMATLRAFLRGQAAHHKSGLSELIAELNKLVFDSSAPNRYATFFYAEFDPVSRELNYVNAGHNAPMIFRSAKQDVVRLEAGGPVVGLIEHCVFTQGCIKLHPGDVFVAFTDGVSEAMNSADDEWGEDRLIETVRPIVAEPAKAIIDRIMASADEFVAGAPQYDDMTLLVMRSF